MSSTGDTKPFIIIESRTLYSNADLAKYIYLELKQIHTSFDVKTSFAQPIGNKAFKTALLCILNNLLTHDRFGEMFYSTLLVLCDELEDSGCTLTQISEGIKLNSIPSLIVPENIQGYLALFSNIVNHQEELLTKAQDIDSELTVVSSSPIHINYVIKALKAISCLANQLLPYFRAQSELYTQSIRNAFAEI